MSTKHDDRYFKRLEQDIDVLKRQVRSLRRVQLVHSEWLDTVNSPLIKRLWWFVQGYRFHRLGRWYDKDRKWSK